jgi:hypothetical protein
LLVFFWGIIISASYLDIDSFFDFVAGLFKSSKTKPIGKITEFTNPGMIRFLLKEDISLEPGELIALADNFGIDDKAPVGIIINKRVSPEKKAYEALILDTSFREGKHDKKLIVYKVQYDSIFVQQKIRNTELIELSKDIIGFASVGTDISTLYFETIRNSEIFEGNLILVPTNSDEKVYYQVINGKIFEESSIDGSSRSLTKAEAEQVGIWNKDDQLFKNHEWVVPENSPVIKSLKAIDKPKDLPLPNISIGNIPDSVFPVNVNIDDIVMYHSAILGVTGCGKTFLAYFLIEKAIERGIKVITIDVSGDYRRFLSDGVILENFNQLVPFLDDGSKNLAIIEPESLNQHPVTTTKKISELCLTWCKENRTTEDIINPNPKLLLVFEEAHVLIPEWNFINNKARTNEVNTTATVGLQARKFGLGFLVVTQRTANVTKSILNQCNTIFAFQAFDETGFDFMKNYLGNKYVSTLPNLKQRRCIVVGQALKSSKPLLFDTYYQDRIPNEEPLPIYQLPDQPI